MSFSSLNTEIPTRFTIRRAALGDAAQIAAVHVAGWQWAYRGHIPDKFLDRISVEQREERWRNTLAEPDTEARVWLAESDHHAVGFATTGLPQSSGHPPLTAELGAFYLVKEATGTGVGRALLDRAIEDLSQRGFRQAVLWVLPSNARARRFYEKAGWRLDGAIKTEEVGDFELLQVRYSLALKSSVIPVPEIRSERLLLRQWRDDDRDPFAAMNGDHRVMEHFPSTLSRTESDETVDRLRAHFVERGFGLWAIELTGVAPLIGFVGLVYPHLPPPFTPRVEVGWRLAYQHWGRGYATEGARAALEVGFRRLGLEEVVSMTVPANVRSRRVMEKLGMRHSPADDFDHPRLPAGHPLRRDVLYRMSRSDFPRGGGSEGR